MQNVKKKWARFFFKDVRKKSKSLEWQQIRFGYSLVPLLLLWWFDKPNRRKNTFQVQTCFKGKKSKSGYWGLGFLFSCWNPHGNGVKTRNEMREWWRKKLRYDECNKIFEQGHYERDNSQRRDREAEWGERMARRRKMSSAGVYFFNNSKNNSFLFLIVIFFCLFPRLICWEG